MLQTSQMFRGENCGVACLYGVMFMSLCQADASGTRIRCNVLVPRLYSGIHSVYVTETSGRSFIDQFVVPFFVCALEQRSARYRTILPHSATLHGLQIIQCCILATNNVIRRCCNLSMLRKTNNKEDKIEREREEKI